MRRPASFDWHFPLVLQETICTHHLLTAQTSLSVCNADRQGHWQRGPDPGVRARLSYPRMTLALAANPEQSLSSPSPGNGRLLTRVCFCNRLLSAPSHALTGSHGTSAKLVGSKCLHPHFADGKHMTCPRSHSRSARRASKLCASKATALP